MMNVSQPRNKHSCGIVHCNFLLLKTRPPYLFTDCAVYSKRTLAPKCTALGGLLYNFWRVIQSTKGQKHQVLNIVTDVNCQITWYISDSSKLSIDQNLMRCSQRIITQLLLQDAAQNTWENVSYSTENLWKTSLWGSDHLLLPCRTFFNCKHVPTFSPGYSSKPLERYHRHSSGLAKLPTHCQMFGSGWFLSPFFGHYVFKKKNWDSSRPYWVEYTTVCICTYKYVCKIHTSCIQ